MLIWRRMLREGVFPERRSAVLDTRTSVIFEASNYFPTI
jgi:hypothetical protein